MGRFVLLLIAPVIIGVLIAAGVVVVNGLRQRRIDARRTLLDAGQPDRAPSPADPAEANRLVPAMRAAVPRASSNAIEAAI